MRGLKQLAEPVFKINVIFQDRHNLTLNRDKKNQEIGDSFHKFNIIGVNN